MVKVGFLGLACILLLHPFSSIFAFEEIQELGEICVSEEVLPAKSSPPKPEKKPLTIRSLKGIVIVSEPDCLFPDQNLNAIEGVVFIGHHPPGNIDTLKDQLHPFLHQTVTEQAVQKIRRTIAHYYRSVGHPLVVVQVPEQEASKGVLLLLVLESRVGEVKLEGNSWTSNQRLREYFRLRPNQVIDEGHLMNDVHFVNRNPFRRIDVIYAPGAEPGTTDVTLKATEKRSFRFYTGADNSGVDPIGQGRYRAGFNWGNALGLDHIMAYQYTMALDTKLFYAHTGEYIIPLPWKHVLDVFGGYSHVEPKKTKGIRRNKGWSLQTSLRYTIPLKVYSSYEHEISGGFDFKRTNNTFEFSEDYPRFGNNVNLTQLLVSYTGSFRRERFQLDFDSHLYWSPGKCLADQTNQAYDSLRPGAKNRWFYFRGSCAYLQTLPYEYSFSLVSRGQYSSQTLLPSEQFGLGGYDTVRGYEQRELNKDHAILVSLEGRSPPLHFLKHKRDALQFLLFADYGWGNNRQNVPCGETAAYLFGAGPGVRYSIPHYLTTQLDWGIKLHKKTAYGGGNSMFHFSITAAY